MDRRGFMQAITGGVAAAIVPGGVVEGSKLEVPDEVFKLPQGEHAFTPILTKTEIRHTNEYWNQMNGPVLTSTRIEGSFCMYVQDDVNAGLLLNRNKPLKVRVHQGSFVYLFTAYITEIHITCDARIKHDDAMAEVHFFAEDWRTEPA